jgi:hypothetical protein
VTIKTHSFTQARDFFLLLSCLYSLYFLLIMGSEFMFLNCTFLEKPFDLIFLFSSFESRWRQNPHHSNTGFLFWIVLWTLFLFLMCSNGVGIFVVTDPHTCGLSKSSFSWTTLPVSPPPSTGTPSPHMTVFTNTLHLVLVQLKWHTSWEYPLKSNGADFPSRPHSAESSRFYDKELSSMSITTVSSVVRQPPLPVSSQLVRPCLNSSPRVRLAFTVGSKITSWFCEKSYHDFFTSVVSYSFIHTPTGWPRTYRFYESWLYNQTWTLHTPPWQGGRRGRREDPVSICLGVWLFCIGEGVSPLVEFIMNQESES